MSNFIQYTLELVEYCKERGIDITQEEIEVSTLKFWWEMGIHPINIYLQYCDYYGIDSNPET